LKSAALTPADVVLANLTGGLLVQAAARLQDLVSDTGTLIVSGLMHTEERDVTAAYGRFNLVDRSQEDEWICMTLQRPGAFA
jgi:ribosomal protein L11 methylase PrmA